MGIKGQGTKDPEIKDLDIPETKAKAIQAIKDQEIKDQGIKAQVIQGKEDIQEIKGATQDKDIQSLEIKAQATLDLVISQITITWTRMFQSQFRFQSPIVNYQVNPQILTESVIPMTPEIPNLASETISLMIAE